MRGEKCRNNKWNNRVCHARYRTVQTADLHMHKLCQRRALRNFIQTCDDLGDYGKIISSENAVLVTIVFFYSMLNETCVGLVSLITNSINAERMH